MLVRDASKVFHRSGVQGSDAETEGPNQGSPGRNDLDFDILDDDSSGKPSIRIILGTCVPCGLCAASIATCYFIVGALWSAIISATLSLLWLAAALHAYLTRSTRPAFYGLCYGLSVYAFGMCWSLGGLDASDGIVQWAFLGPLITVTAGCVLPSMTPPTPCASIVKVRDNNGQTGSQAETRPSYPQPKGKCFVGGSDIWQQQENTVKQNERG